MAAKKKSAAKRTPAQKRATARLVAMNKKKRAASKRKTTARKKTTRRNPVRPLRSRAKKKAAARRANPRTKRYVVAVTDWPAPGQKVYIVSVNWRNGVWVIDSKKEHAIRGTKQNMESIGESVIGQMRERMPNFNPFKNVYLEEV